MYTHKELIESFKSYNDVKKLSILTLGCGAGFSKILETPGLSKYMYSISNAYDLLFLEDLIGCIDDLDSEHIVSENNTEVIGTNLWYYDVNVIVVNGTLTTSRYRKGLNRAHYYIRYKGLTEVGEIHLTKEEDPNFYNNIDNVILKRQIEDDLVCTRVLKEFFDVVRASS